MDPAVIVEKIELIEQLSNQILDKYQHILYNQTVLNQTLLNFMNNITLAKNLTRSTFIFLYFTKEQERKEAFKKADYLTIHAPQLLTKPVNIQWYLKTLEVIIDMLTETQQTNLKNVLLINFMEQKFRIFMVIYRYAITFDNQDIFSLDKTHDNWNFVSKFTTFKILAPPTNMINSINNFRKSIKTATAVLEKASKTESDLSKFSSYIFGGIKYLLNQTKADNASKQFKSDMQIKKVRSMVNFFEEGFSKYLINIAFPFISYKDKIYIKYSYKSLTKQSVMRWMKRGFGQIQLDEPQVKLDANDKKLFIQKEGRIPVRVLSHKDCTKTKSPGNKFSKVILHIHGGGFIGFSSRSHQLYTRKWAKQSNIPIFSVDYRKAPQTPYPGPLNDCWQVYNWILQESHKYFNISENKQIILAGDSAGGNMIMGITNLCLQLGVQKPLAILSFYPALNLVMQSFTPSLMHSLQDPLLSFQFLFLCLRSYVQGIQFNASKDYYISPIFTPMNLLKQYPPVRMFVGQTDPLYDDSIRFGIKLKNNNVDVKIISYQNMIHGFLQLDVPGGVKYAQQCIIDSIQGIKQFN